MNYYNDSDRHCVAWLRELISAGELPPGDVDDRPIEEVQPADLEPYEQHHFFAGIGGCPLALAMAGWTGPVWTGSCPCQPFSAAGKRLGESDERHVWPAWLRLISECRPPTLFGEQVSGRAGLDWLAGVRADLETLAYAVGAADLCAASVGAPHIRQRLFWVADADAAGLKDAPGRSGPAEPDRRTIPAGLPAESRLRGWPPEPNVGRVVHGVSGELVRGYGNAIVPQVAAAFVRAFLDCG